MDQSNPYQFPFGPDRNSASTSPASQGDDPFGFGSPTGYSQNVPPPRKLTPDTYSPVQAEVAQPLKPASSRRRKLAVSANSAIASMILGIISLFGFFLGITIFAALGAIITGHFGLSRIKRSAGALTGKGMAITGLITGYTGLVLSMLIIGLFINMINNRPGRHQAAAFDLEEEAALLDDGESAELKAKIAASESVLSSVEKKLEGAGLDTAHGNSSEAIALAEEFNNRMHKFGSKAPENSPMGDGMKGFTYATHCELHPDRVALMVRVHGSDRAFNNSKNSLKQLSWVTAVHHLKDSLPLTHHVAVCLRDSSGTVSIQYGTPVDYQPQSELERESLVGFYASSDDELLEISSVELLSFPNRPLGNGPNQFGPGRGMPGLVDPTSIPPSHRRDVPTSAMLLRQRLRKASPSGLRQDAPELPAYTGQALELNPEKYATLILDATLSPTTGSYSLGDITAAKFSPDGKQVAVGNEEGSLILYQLKEEKFYSIPTKIASNRSITALAYSPQGDKVYVASNEGSIVSHTIDKLPTESQDVKLIKQLRPAKQMVLSPDGKMLYSTAGRALNWQPALASGAIQTSSNSVFDIESVSLDRDGTGIFYSEGNQLFRLDFANHSPQKILEWSRSPELPVDICPAAQLVASSDRTSVTVRDITDSNLYDTISFPERISSMRLTPQGDRLVMGADGVVTVWDAKRSEHLLTYKVDYGFAMIVRDISPDGKFAAVQSHLRDSVLYVLPLPAALPPAAADSIAETEPDPEPMEVSSVDAKTTSDAEELSTDPPTYTDPFEPKSKTSTTSAFDSTPPLRVAKQLPIADYVLAVFRDLAPGVEPIAFSFTSKQMVAGKGENNLIYYDVDKNKKQSFTIDKLGIVSAISYSLDGHQVFVGAKNGKIFALDINDSGQITLQREFAGHQGEVTSLITGLNGRFIASAGRDNRIVWQQLTSNGKLRELTIPGAAIDGLFELPRKATVLATDGKQFTRVNMVTAVGEKDQPLSDLGKSAGQVSPDGKFVAGIDGLNIHTWDVAQEKPLAKLAINETIRALRFTRDGKYLLAVGRSQVTVFRPQESKALAQFVFPRGSDLHQLTVSPDGKQFAVYLDSLGQALYVVSLSGLESLK